MNLSDFDIKDFDFSDTKKFDDFDREYRFLVVFRIATEESYQRFKEFCQTSWQHDKEPLDFPLRI